MFAKRLITIDSQNTVRNNHAAHLKTDHSSDQTPILYLHSLITLPQPGFLPCFATSEITRLLFLSDYLTTKIDLGLPWS